MAFEDFPVGHVYETGSLSVSEQDILSFAREWDPQPFHIDPEAAAESVYGGIIGSGFQTLLLAFRLCLRDGGWAECSMGAPGMENVEWLQPVRPGDTLRVVAEVVASKPSRSKPDRGFTTVRHEVRNQIDTVVCRYTATHMLRRRS